MINKEFRYTKLIDVQDCDEFYQLKLNFYFTKYLRQITFFLTKGIYTTEVCKLNQIENGKWCTPEINWMAWGSRDLTVSAIVGSVLIIASDIACDMVNHELVKEAYQHGEVLGE